MKIEIENGSAVTGVYPSPNNNPTVNLNDTSLAALPTFIALEARVTALEGGGGGSGYMLKSVYDTNDDGKVNSAVVADRALDGILNALIFG